VSLSSSKLDEASPDLGDIQIANSSGGANSAVVAGPIW
jgi:hypothetical protein